MQLIIGLVYIIAFIAFMIGLILIPSALFVWAVSVLFPHVLSFTFINVVCTFIVLAILGGIFRGYK